jgi:very-short-patch-repair endonuclease
MGRLGVRFRRQHPVPPYTFDFACLPLRVAVEVDGDSHAQGGVGRDARRDAVLAGAGWLVVRVTNAEVMGNLEGVLVRIGEVVGEVREGRG